MPSRGNPNVPNKERRVSSRRKIQKKNSINKISKNPRGTATSSVLHPTSGPLAPVSSKKARKLERARMKALKRALEEEGEDVGMADAPILKEKKVTKAAHGATKAQEESMDIDVIE